MLSLPKQGLLMDCNHVFVCQIKDVLLVSTFIFTLLKTISLYGNVHLVFQYKCKSYAFTKIRYISLVASKVSDVGSWNP